MSHEDRTQLLCALLASVDDRRNDSDGSSSRSKDEGHVSQDEGLPISEYGGIQPGTKLCSGRYVVIERVGCGHFSGVFLSYDYHTRRSVAIKVQRSAEHYIEAARDEIQLLSDLHRKDPSGSKPVVKLLNNFEHYYQVDSSGHRTLHVCMVFEVLGKTLLSLIKRCNYKGAPLTLVKLIARKVLEGLDFSHTQCQIIHTDLKPENVMFELSEEEEVEIEREVERRAMAMEHDGNGSFEEMGRPLMKSFDRDVIDRQFALGKVKIIDFGNACWTYKQFVSDIQTRQYRCPEAILGAGYDTSADIWSAACVFFEILTGEYLFDPRSTQAYSRDEDHLAMMMEMVGPFPSKLIAAGAYSRKYFNHHGRLRNIDHTKYVGIAKILHRKYRFSLEASLEMADFLRPMLEINPNKRATAHECLQHPFLNLKDTERGSKGRRHRDSNRSSRTRDEDSGHRRKNHYPLNRSKYQRAYRRLFSDQE